MAAQKIKNEFDTDYQLVGVASTLKEYKLCHHLNTLLGCDFKKLDELVFEPKDRSRTITFSVFKAHDEETNNDFVVFTNRNLGEFLLPEVNNFDYIIQVNGKYTKEQMKDLLGGIKNFSGVLMCAPIPLRKIKSRERLVYEEEKPVQQRYKR
ncbi:MAG TPA: IPExxxVDY family protein [Chitinophagales bacterium]|nr:IPExxxVDY family protein [Chitinophagales bacterium]